MSTHTPVGEDEVTAHAPGDASAEASRRDAAPRGTESPDGATLEDRQRAYLLRQLLEAPGHTLGQGEANRKIGAVARRELQLEPGTATALREELVQAGCIRTSQQGRTVKLTLTEEGREVLQRLPEDLFAPVKSPPARLPRSETDPPPELLAYQQAYVLLLLLKGKDRQLRSAEFTDRLRTQEARTLGLEGTVSRKAIAPLLEEGWVEERRARQVAGDGLYPQPFASYALTQKGEQRLLTMRQYPHTTFKIPTDSWNVLVDAHNKRVAALEREDVPPDTVASSHGAGEEMAPNRLAAAILGHFEELLRAKYPHAGMVPIHELRAWVDQQFGPDAASHKTFDAAVHDLQRQNKVRFVTITDLRDGTAQQMENSIPGVNETFFYLEPAHEQSFDF